MPWDNDFEFFGDGFLCSLEPNAHLLMEIYVERGVGYLSAERERPSQPPLPVDALLADAIFSPVKRVNYTIEPARVGQSIDYERLILEVWTNGAISPEEAVGEASRIAQDYFSQIADTVGTAPLMISKPADTRPEKIDVEVKEITTDTESEAPEIFTHSIHELELSIRSENCLLRGGIHTVGDLLQRSRDDLLKIRNLGKISLTEIEKKLTTLGYALKPESKKSSDDESNDEADYTDEENEFYESDENSDAELESKSTEPEEQKSESKSESEAEAESEVKPKPKTKSKSKSTKSKAKK
jgi:DNA-directed RNA polymerase subunit alpha